jgi:hypothetical protein
MAIFAASHMHSLWSYDGHWKLEEIVREFSARGYQVLLMTEHDRGFTQSRWMEYREVCRELSSEKMLVVPGIEYSDPDNLIHILTWGDVPFLGENLPTRSMLAGVREAGGVAVMAHPSRRKAWQRFDPAWSEYLIGIEAWNRKTDGWRPSPDASPLLTASGCTPFVGMDFHERRQIFPLAMVLDCAMPVSERAVVDCLRSRRCEPRAFDIALRPGVTEAMQVSLLPFEAARRGLRWIYRRTRAVGARAPEVSPKPPRVNR